MTALKIADLQRDAYTEGREEGISIGIERGAYQTKLETAMSLLQDGFPPEMISKYTALSIAVIEGLIKDD